ncbi:MAG: MoaD/ThiS family protein [Anaerolineales bacterium]|nr:MoaD/ThiS family protein [Anaerolineales bacterium]MDD5468174.1 MoaD/ThiS family protein [Anaerolineales bacterium]
MRVNFYATLRQIVGGKTLELNIPKGATLRQLLDKIIELHPLLKRELFDETGKLYGHVHVLVNGRDVPYLENVLDTQLNPEDTVNIFPAVGGGRD